MSRLAFLLAPALALAASSACTSSIDTGGSGGSSSASTGASAGGSSPCADPAAPAAFEIGGGEACFERLTAGQTVPTMQGPQGGFHLWLGVGCSDCGAKPILQYGVKDPATGDWFADTFPQKEVIALDSSGWGQLAGITAFLPGVVWDPMSQLPKGSHVILSAAVLDGSGDVVHEGEIELVLGDVEIWDVPCDENPDTCGLPGGAPCCTLG